jgi:hypothetical protein
VMKGQVSHFIIFILSFYSMQLSLFFSHHSPLGGLTIINFSIGTH